MNPLGGAAGSLRIRLAGRLNGWGVSGRIDFLPPGDGCRFFSFVAAAVTWSRGACGC